ncbi:uncharacterized protein N7503_006517 [Penicillium pulvis]|uniref:uncharacterized protein n=1 Tax=Penicillium pulvis TaxID=1562058 RepID=UPI0025491CD4|nr:uncharacterized protein N7503_006517 [Penicillium pulvis]KAJ5799012.1 hypothetical protein N7503_006517 [Penicillium pulvis]
MWTDIHTLPETNPLHRGTDQIRKFRRYHRSPLYQVADALRHIDMETLEIIDPFTLAPWDERVQANINGQYEPQTKAGGLMQIAISSSAQNELVGFRVTIEKWPPRNRKLKLKTREGRVEPVLCGAGSHGTYIENDSRNQGLQDYVAHK